MVIKHFSSKIKKNKEDHEITFLGLAVKKTPGFLKMLKILKE